VVKKTLKLKFQHLLH